MAISKQIEDLKAKALMFTKDYMVDKTSGKFALLTFEPGTRLCLERGRLFTESYKETEGEPESIRKAKALYKTLENMTIYIQDNELLVCNYASDPSALAVYPELNVSLLEDGVTGKGYISFEHMVTQDEKEELLDICKYWRGKSLDDRVRSILPDEVKDYIDFNGLNEAQRFSHGIGGAVQNIEPLLHIGLKGVIEKIDDRLSELNASASGVVNKGDYIDQVNNLEAMKLACKAMIRFGERYAELARDMAKVEKDTKRKEELEKIADVCSRVPGDPASSLHEALQSWLFSHYVNRLIEHHGQGGGYRFDLLFNPFYQEDLDKGRLSREGALELVEALFIKIHEMAHYETREGHGAEAGGKLFQNIVIGGVTSEGEDASNEFTLLLLDAGMELRLPETNLALRYHPTLNSEVISKTIDCLRSGIGYPSIFNDSAIIPMLLARNIPLEDTRNYSIPGCVPWQLVGKSLKTNIPNAGVISTGKCLELALNQGKDPKTGRQMGCLTPDPVTFESVEDVFEAYLSQLGFVAQKIATIGDIAEAIYSRYCPRPFLSALVDGCIEKGKDCTAWQEYPDPNIIITSPIDVADSIAAMKKVVFEEKQATIEELLDALKKNFEGYEELHQRLLEVPKYGNDEDYADHIAREVHHRSFQELQKLNSFWEVPYRTDGAIVAAYVPFGRRCGALPSGRKSGEPFADGTISPYGGFNTEGPTAVLKSVGKVTPLFPELFNQKFEPQFLEGEFKVIFADYLRSWHDLGIYHIQFNVLDEEVLKDAQAKPDKYRDLIVRVAGYSAYFVSLNKDMQDEVIQRVCQGFA